MAPTRPSKHSKATTHNQARKANTAASRKSPKQLLVEATALVEQGDALAAIATAKQALDAALISNDLRACAAYNLLGEINVELGEMITARTCFGEAAKLDVDGSLAEELGGGPEKFHWLAQLSEDGGSDSVAWFEKAATYLRAQVQALADAVAEVKQKDSSHGAAERVLQARSDEKRRKLAETLCAVAEVYMTDLSWEADAETRCEALVTEATMLAPELPDSWQTLANVRVSQNRREDAVSALERSLELWKDLDSMDPRVPPFPSRVALVRLLMECELEAKAKALCSQLILEDDTSVEAWYLGGLAHYTLGEKAKTAKLIEMNSLMDEGEDEKESWKKHFLRARQWLSQCLLLFEAQEYEDERLGEHALELLAAVNAENGVHADEEEDDDSEDDQDWEDVDEDDSVR